MRSSFPEFYRPTPDEDERFIKTGTVVIDANVLLGLYRMSSAQREKVLGVFESLKDRLWIPYQVGLEYQRNRMGVIQEQASYYRKLQELHGVKSVDDYLEGFSNLTLPPEVSREAEPLIAPLRKKLAKAARTYVEKIGEITERHIVTVEQGEHDDPVRNRLDSLFEGHVGARPDGGVHDQRVKEAQKRIAEKIPPGYKDDKKEGDERKAGDYLLWAEVLEHAKATEPDGLPTLLVTNDTKDDWYYRSAGKVAGPRPELVREFGKHSSNGYHQVTLEGLLRLANVHLGAEVDEATIEKASELAKPRRSGSIRVPLADLLQSLDSEQKKQIFLSASAQDTFKGFLANQPQQAWFHHGDAVKWSDLIDSAADSDAVKWSDLIDSSSDSDAVKWSDLIDSSEGRRGIMSDRHRTAAEPLRRWLEKAHADLPESGESTEQDDQDEDQQQD